jgi:hypothetical protein
MYLNRDPLTAHRRNGSGESLAADTDAVGRI